MANLTIKPSALPVNMDHSHLDYKKPTQTPQRLTRTDIDMHILDWFILISCNSPCLPVIQAHLAARGHPIGAERVTEVILLFTPHNRGDFPQLYLTLLPISPGGPRGPWKTWAKCLNINIWTPSRRLCFGPVSLKCGGQSSHGRRKNWIIVTVYSVTL